MRIHLNKHAKGGGRLISSNRRLENSKGNTSTSYSVIWLLLLLVEVSISAPTMRYIQMSISKAVFHRKCPFLKVGSAFGL
jgi:hypothetical protein